MHSRATHHQVGSPPAVPARHRAQASLTVKEPHGVAISAPRPSAGDAAAARPFNVRTQASAFVTR